MPASTGWSGLENEPALPLRLWREESPHRSITQWSPEDRRALGANGRVETGRVDSQIVLATPVPALREMTSADFLAQCAPSLTAGGHPLQAESDSYRSFPNRRETRRAHERRMTGLSPARSRANRDSHTNQRRDSSGEWEILFEQVLGETPLLVPSL